MRRGKAPETAVLFLAVALVGPAAAQRESYSYVSYSGSDVSLISTASDEETARINTPVLGGDRIVTGPGSRAEVVLASGNIVRIDAKTELRFDRMAHTYESDDDRDLLYLLRGTIAVEVRDAASGDLAFRLDTEDTTVVMEGRGHVRVDAGRRGTEIWVLSGEAEVAGRGGSVVLQAGESAAVRGSEPVEAETFDPPRDKFARFIDDRSNHRPRTEIETYVGSDLQYEATAGDLEDNGNWVYVSDYQRWCWRPTVTADWRPYGNGTWRWTPCGLTWVSYEPWGWLPYHFGSWCWDSLAGWVWIPDSYYSPAWVYWDYSPNWTGWCPMGYYRRPRHNPVNKIVYGPDRRGSQVPNFHGRVEISQVDPRGWNYAPVSRLGGRLDPSHDILRGERVPFRPGEIGVVSTTPLKIERGQGPASAAVRDAVQKISEAPVSKGSLPVNNGLTSLLRRDPTLTPAAEQELRRSFVPIRDPRILRAVSPETLLQTRVTEVAPAGGEDWRTTPSRQRVSGTTRVSSTQTPDPVRENGWRSPASTAPRDIAPKTSAPAGSDTGWRAPRPPSSSRAVTPSARRTSEGDWRDAPRRAAPAPAPAPRYETSRPAPAPAPAPHVSAPAPHFSAPAPAPAPHVAPAPRAESPKQR
ncbi:MAG: DUF6600 domain-containing protein [Thermoanaerobaculia bacterium]